MTDEFAQLPDDAEDRTPPSDPAGEPLEPSPAEKPVAVPQVEPAATEGAAPAELPEAPFTSLSGHAPDDTMPLPLTDLAEPAAPLPDVGTAEVVAPLLGEELDEEPSAPLLDERTMHPLPPLPEELENPLPPLPGDVAEKPGGLSSLGAVARVIVLPRSTFKLVAEESKPAWAAALAVVALAAVTKGGVAIGLAVRGVVPSGELSSVIVRYGGALLGPIAFAFVAAGIVLAAQRWWQGDARFLTLLSVVSLSLVPLAIRDFGQALYMAVRHRVLLHPGLSALIAPPGRSALGRSAYALLGQVDAFALWTLVLLAVAVGVTHGRGKLRPVLTMLLIGVLSAVVASVPSFAIAPFLTR